MVRWTGHIVFRDKMLGLLIFGLQSKGLSLEPLFLLLRGRRLKREIKAVYTGKPQGKTHNDSLKKRWSEPENILPLLLNLLSYCIVYCSKIVCGLAIE
jgi:hypothetical protein